MSLKAGVSWSCWMSQRRRRRRRWRWRFTSCWFMQKTTEIVVFQNCSSFFSILQARAVTLDHPRTPYDATDQGQPVSRVIFKPPHKLLKPAQLNSSPFSDLNHSLLVCAASSAPRSQRFGGVLLAPVSAQKMKYHVSRIADGHVKTHTQTEKPP